MQPRVGGGYQSVAGAGGWDVPPSDGDAAHAADSAHPPPPLALRRCAGRCQLPVGPAPGGGRSGRVGPAGRSGSRCAREGCLRRRAARTQRRRLCCLLSTLSFRSPPRPPGALAGRTEVLPVQWRKHLQLEADMLSRQLMPPGIPSLREVRQGAAGGRPVGRGVGRGCIRRTGALAPLCGLCQAGTLWVCSQTGRRRPRAILRRRCTPPLWRSFYT